MMFYERDNEVALLRDIERRSATKSQMTVIGGRKRVGKTALLRCAYANRDVPVVYLFVERKNEHLLCLDIMRIVGNWLGVQLEASDSIVSLFEQLVDYSAVRNFTLVVDECQNLLSVNSGVYGAMAEVWRRKGRSARMNLVFCGSNHSQMYNLFVDAEGPMSNLVTNRIDLKPFSIKTLKNILANHNPSYEPDDLLMFAMITGGVASYVAELVRKEAFTRSDILGAVLDDGSMFVTEGRDMLVEELGRDSQTYLSILYAISAGHATRGDITTVIGVECGGYLDKLERIYGLITRHRPYLQPDNTRNVQYGLKDNFLSFWFRYIYRHRSAVEFGDYDYVRRCVDDDYHAYREIMLKKYFRQLYRESSNYDMVVNYWEKGGDNAVDLIAVNNRDKRCVIANCASDATCVDVNALDNMSEVIRAKQEGYSVDSLVLGMSDM